MKSIIAISLMSLSIFSNCGSNSHESEASPESGKNQILQGEIVDLTHVFSDETVYWVTAKEFELDTVYHGETDKGYYYSAFNFSTAEHGGTHIDAPSHFAKNGQTVDEIPLENLIGAAIKIDIASKVFNNPDYLITIEDLMDWEEKENSRIPDEGIILLQTGFSKYYPDKAKYLGTDRRGQEAIKDLHFPGLSPEAADMTELDLPIPILLKKVSCKKLAPIVWVLSTHQASKLINTTYRGSLHLMD